MEALAHLGHAALGLGHPFQAWQYLYEALQTAAEIEDLRSVLFTLSTTALYLAERGEAERAAEVYVLAVGYLYIGNSRFWEDIAGKHIAAVATEILPPEVVAAVQERGRARDLWAMVEKLLVELAADVKT